MSREYKYYSEKFKKDAVEKFNNRGEKSIRTLADELGVNYSTLYSWTSRKKRNMILELVQEEDGINLLNENRALRAELQLCRDRLAKAYETATRLATQLLKEKNDE